MDKASRNKRNQEVLRLYNSGNSYRAIANIVGLSKTAVHKIIHKVIDFGVSENNSGINVPSLRDLADRYQDFFNFLNQEHNLILTISEMDEIISEVGKFKNQFAK